MAVPNGLCFGGGLLPEVQVQRVTSRSALSEFTIRNIMATQATRSQRLASADAVVLNEGNDLVALHQQLYQFLQALRLMPL